LNRGIFQPSEGCSVFDLAKPKKALDKLVKIEFLTLHQEKARMIDEIDRRILMILQDNARTSNADIARAVSMAPSAVLERVRKLERKGVIIGYEARIDPSKVELDLTAFTFVKTDEPVGAIDTGQQLAAVPGVQEVHYVAGTAAYLIKVRAPDTRSLADLLKVIGRLSTVRDTNTTVVLQTVKETGALPLGSLPQPGED
jgi:Lrp/AsnC family leucine-responsive transcriptional regulator